MKPVDQTRFGVPEGNCFAACVASLLELPLEQVPHFPDHGADWYSAFRDWLRARRLYPVCFEVKRPEDGRPDGMHILSGKSPRGEFLHSVVAKGAYIVHDPHPSRAGIRTEEDAILLVPFDPANV